MKSSGENILLVVATALHYFVYFSISKFFPKIQFPSEAGEIGNIPEFCKMRQQYPSNLPFQKGEGDILNVKPRKTSLMKWWKSRGKHQLSLGKDLFRLPRGLWLYKFFLFSSRNGFNENQQKRALLTAQVGCAFAGEGGWEPIHPALGCAVTATMRPLWREIECQPDRKHKEEAKWLLSCLPGTLRAMRSPHGLVPNEMLP